MALCCLGEGDRNNSVKFKQCSGWVHKCCSGVKVSLSMVGDTIVCKVSQKARGGDGGNV